MQTFLPYPDFQRSAIVLDWRRLGKQRVEAKQIFEALYRQGGAWYKHPATLMWKGYEPALCAYGIAICNEWVQRGYNDTLTEYFSVQYHPRTPPWFGDQRIHASHRGRLLAKDPVWYGKWGWTDPPVEKVVYARDIC